jgi:hypothetical protein
MHTDPEENGILLPTGDSTPKSPSSAAATHKTSSLQGASVALGCVAGLVLGLGVGGLLALLIDASMPEVRAVVVLHSALAATLTGGWTAPCLLSDDP